MLLVIASRLDVAAPRLVARWAAYRAAVLTSRDLSVAGWRWYPGEPHASVMVASGQQVPASAVTGVLTRLPAVGEDELPHIVPEDRTYVAAEMTAFLRAWLAELTCPMLNRPTPSCLSGPAWRPERWTYTAARLGLPVQPVHRRAEPRPRGVSQDAAAPVTTVTIVGERSFGAVASVLAAQARRLADAAGVNLLGVQFSGPEEGARFVGATLWPSLFDEEVADAVATYLHGGSQGARDAERIES